MTEEQRYYFLAQADEHPALGATTPAEQVISIPWWPEAVTNYYRKEVERVDAPMLFTAREKAEEALRHLVNQEPEAFLAIVAEVGEADAQDALDNSAPLHVFELDRGDLLDKLQDSDFLCVDLDGRFKLRRDLIEYLRHPGAGAAG